MEKFKISANSHLKQNEKIKYVKKEDKCNKERQILTRFSGNMGIHSSDALNLTLKEIGLISFFRHRQLYVTSSWASSLHNYVNRLFDI